MSDVTGEVTEIVPGSLDVLELNLLHVGWAFRFEPLRLNKSGAPNRRSLGRTASGVVMPGMRREIGEDVDLSDPEQIDYLAFVLAVSLELGTLGTSEDGGELRADPEKQTEFYNATPVVRARRVHDAMTRLRYWNELRSHAFWQTEQRDEEHLSLLEPTGERLIGARSAVFSVIRKMRPDGWTRVEELADRCLDQHDDFLTRALADDVATFGFAHAVVRRALSWSGLADVGKLEDEPMFRLTSRGAAAFGAPVDEEPRAASGKGLVVQPNLEVTAMLDSTPLSVLHSLYQIADRRALADRVATFVLSAQTAQRGYASGASAEEATAMFDTRGVTPLPDAVRFQLDDWERMHRRVTIYADGILFRHADPDHLDMIVGQLRHDNPGVSFVRMGPSTTLASSTELEGLDRVIKRGQAFDVDYLGTPPPCLAFVDSLTVQTDPVACDVVTDWELRRIADEVEATRTTRVFRLNVDAIAKRWPKEPFQHVVDFLEPRVLEGLPAVQYLKLRSLLDKPTKASIRHAVTVLTIDNTEDADRLANAPEVSSYIVGRLGDRTFAIDPELEQELLDVLHDIGIRGGSLDE